MLLSLPCVAASRETEIEVQEQKGDMAMMFFLAVLIFAHFLGCVCGAVSLWMMMMRMPGTKLKAPKSGKKTNDSAEVGTAKLELIYIARSGECFHVFTVCLVVLCIHSFDFYRHPFINDYMFYTLVATSDDGQCFQLKMHF